MLGLNYMAWLGLLVWVGVPLLAVLATTLLWRRSRSGLKKALALVVGFAILSAPALVSNGVKAHYDRQVRELCAKDGGVKVYETVRLSAERFNQWGQPNFNIPVTPFIKLKATDKYYLEWKITNLKLGNPKLERSHFRLIRRSDNKLLGESVSYSRGGGDLPGPWHGSSFICPEPTKHQSLESSIFIKGDKQ
ncbi:MAG: hypothetical protein ACYCY9_05665 [Thiobacillus sp.]